MNDTLVAEYWAQFVAAHPEKTLPGDPYATDAFGDSPEMADRLGRLVASGNKTATCSAYWEYEFEKEPVPKIGDRLIIVDGRGAPLCITETTEVEIRAFDEVDAAFARDEGAADLTEWRDAHWNFFSRILPGIGKKPTEDMPLVCERFEIIHR